MKNKAPAREDLTNVEFVTKLMEFSKFGPLAQLFVIDALDKWSQKIIDSQEQVLVQMKDGFVSGEAWVGVAKEINAKVKAQYQP